MRRAAAFAAAASALVLLAGCVRSTRVQPQAPLDTGVPLVLEAASGRALEWDFGDGAPGQRGPSVSHTYRAQGQYTVRGRDGAFVEEQREVLVRPRSLPRAVPARADLLLYVPTLRDDLPATVDFLEKLIGAGPAQSMLEDQGLPAFAVELGSAGDATLDPLEGVGFFSLAGFESELSLVGVGDEERALEALVAFLAVRGATAAPAQSGQRALTARDGEALLAFVDRGYLYLAHLDPADDGQALVAAVRSGSPLGLETEPSFASELRPAGSLLAWLKGPAGQAQQARPFDAAIAGLSPKGREARLEGRVLADRPLFAGRSQVARSLLEAAPEGPAAVLSVALPPGDLRVLVLGAPGEPRRERMRKRFARLGVDLEALALALTGSAAAATWFDAEGFLANLLKGNQRPELKGTVKVDVGLVSSEVIAAQVARFFEVMKVPAIKSAEPGVSTWRATTGDTPLEARLTAEALSVSVGSPLKGRATVPLAAQLAERFEGAFSPGHASLLVDVGQVRRELQVPRLIPGVDLTRLVTVQGFASAFLDQLTTVDLVWVDLAPDARGAALKGRVQLTAPDPD